MLGTNTSASLGRTVTLPPGTSSHLETLREEELRRRRRQQQERPSRAEERPQRQQAPAPPRRLAPQRKQKTTVVAANPSPGLPIDVGVSSVQDDGDGDIVGSFLGGEEKDGVDDIVRNVADWTLHDAKRDRDSLAKERQLDGVPTVGDSGDVEREYHGEIESVDSNCDGGSVDDDDNDEEEEEDSFKIITEEDVSLDPPSPTSPIVLVDLEALCGYRPEAQNEKEVMEWQIVEALLGTREQQEDGSSDEKHTVKEDGVGSSNLGDGISLDFNERVAELFETGAASHADSSNPIAMSLSAKVDAAERGAEGKEEVSPYTVVPYPEFLSEQDSTVARSTKRMWKLLHTIPTEDPQIAPLMSRIITHLRNTSRSLIWKADMHRELSLLARREHTLHKRRTQRGEYEEWKESARGERLEKLYEIRETFSIRVDVARKLYEKLVDEREGRVERELRRRGLHGLRMELHKSNVLGRGRSDDDDRIDNDCDNDGWGGAIHEDDIIGEETTLDQGHFGGPLDEDEVENDEWSPINTTANPLGINIVLNGVKNTMSESKPNAASESKSSDQLKDAVKAPGRLELISRDENLKRKSERLRKKQEQAAAAATPSKRDEYLKSQENSIREMLKTNDERVTHVALLKLEERLRGVDDLLESLQEEEWADEEGGEERGGLSGALDEGSDLSEVNVLDQVLAMILGALPRRAGGREATEEEHYRYVKGEHDSIAKEWIEAFGRLPPFPSHEPEPEPLKDHADHEGGVTPCGDGFYPSKSQFPVGSHKEQVAVSGTNNDLNLVGNEDSNWDEVEDWDAMFP